MKKDLLDNELIEKEIEEFLSMYTVKHIEDEKIDDTIDVLRAYVPRKKEKTNIVELIINEVKYIDRLYILSVILIMLLGLVLNKINKASVYMNILFVSPLPMLLGIYEVIKSRKNKMWEIEKSCKYSYSKVFLSKMVIIMIMTTVVNMILCLSVNYGNTENIFSKLMTAWIVPLCILSSINLIMISKNSRINGGVLTFIVWLIVLVIEEKRIVTIIEAAGNIVLFTIMIASIGILLYSIYKFYKNIENYEGELAWN